MTLLAAAEPIVVMAKQADVSISCREMESAYLQGVDLEKVTLAMIHAKREGEELRVLARQCLANE